MSEDITRREALKKGALLGGAALVWVRPSVQTYGMSATLAAQASGSGGCTPGFWKNSPDRALELTGIDIKTATVGSLFSGATAATSGDPLIHALDYPGGPDEEGAEHILLRAAVAGYLNSIAVAGYGIGNFDLVMRVNIAISSADRDAMLALAAEIDAENNAGCPLMADPSTSTSELSTSETEITEASTTETTEASTTETTEASTTETTEASTTETTQPEQTTATVVEPSGETEESAGDE